MEEITNTNIEEQKEEAKTYSQEEVDALLQKNGDRRVTEALKKRSRRSNRGWQTRRRFQNLMRTQGRRRRRTCTSPNLKRS